MEKINEIKPLVSICIPTYNGGLFLQEALNSVKKQTYRNIEVIVSDDRSIDTTIEILKAFQNGVDFPVRIYNHNPKGIGANWNNCIRKANGKYIKFLFQDDVLAPTCIKEMINVMESDDKIGLVASKREFLVENELTNEIKNWIDNYKNLQIQFEGTNTITYIDRSFFSRPDFLKSPMNKIGEPPTTLFKKEIVSEVGYFDEDLEQILDYVFYYRILKLYSIAIVNKSLVWFRIHNNQATNINRSKEINDYERYKRILYNEFYSLLHPSNKKKLALKYSLKAKLINKLHRAFRRLRS